MPLRRVMRNSMPKKLLNLAWPIGISLLFLAAWETANRVLGVRSIILPSPSQIIEAMIERHDLLLSHLWPSLYLTVLGFVLSVIGGIVVAVMITYSPLLRLGVYPIIVISQVIPKISIAPLFIVWFGTGTMSSLLVGGLRRRRRPGIEIGVVGEKVGRCIGIAAGIALDVGLPLIGGRGEKMRKRHQHDRDHVGMLA